MTASSRLGSQNWNRGSASGLKEKSTGSGLWQGQRWGYPPRGTWHSQAPALRHPYLSQLRLVTQHVLHVTCEPGHGVNQDRDPTPLLHRHPRPGGPRGSGSPTTLRLSPFIPWLPRAPQRVCRRGAGAPTPPQTEPARPRRPALTVAVPVHRALAEDHDVLGEGAGLVGKDVLHLPQLLIEGGGPGLGWRPALGTVHLLVPVDEVAVAETDHLHAAGGGQPGITGAGQHALLSQRRAHTRPPRTPKRLGHPGTQGPHVARRLPRPSPGLARTRSYRQPPPSQGWGRGAWHRGDSPRGSPGISHTYAPQTPSPAPRADSNELVGGVGVTRSYLGAKGDRTHAGERKEREIKREREGDSAGAWELQEGRAK